jgi:hypothetical protein
MFHELELERYRAPPFMIPDSRGRDALASLYLRSRT